MTTLLNVLCAICHIPSTELLMRSSARNANVMFVRTAIARFTIYHIKRSFSPKISRLSSRKKARIRRKKEKRKNKSKAQEVKSIVQKNAQKTKSDDDNLEEKSFVPDKSDCEADVREEMKDAEKSQHPIDFSLYLQQTGSIIALARLMDALDEGNGFGEEFDHKSLRRNQ
eukprot:563406_1